MFSTTARITSRPVARSFSTRAPPWLGSAGGSAAGARPQVYPYGKQARGVLRRDAARLPDLAQRLKAFPIVLDPQVRRDAMRNQDVHHLADRQTGELGRLAQRGFAVAV